MTGNSVEPSLPQLYKIFTPGYSTWILNHTDNDIETLTATDADMRRCQY